jgi:hypothetical protein
MSSNPLEIQKSPLFQFRFAAGNIKLTTLNISGKLLF